jgi:hypothetical protein
MLLDYKQLRNNIWGILNLHSKSCIVCIYNSHFRTWFSGLSTNTCYITYIKFIIPREFYDVVNLNFLLIKTYEYLFQHLRQFNRYTTVYPANIFLTLQCTALCAEVRIFRCFQFCSLTKVTHNLKTNCM